MMTAFKVVGRRSLWAGLGTLALLTACSTAPPHYKTALTGEKEVPPVNTAASGLSDISVRPGKCPSAGSSSDMHVCSSGPCRPAGVASATGGPNPRSGAVGSTNGPVIVTLVKTR